MFESMKHKNLILMIKGDILGGIVSAIVAFPQALAFGVATGLGASSGIWGCIILCFFAGIFGSKLPMISGPTGPVAIVTASVFAMYNDFSAVIVVFLLASIFQIIISYTQLPSIVRYVPYPVISGFMNGVGSILIIMQLNILMGIDGSASPLSSLKKLILNFTDFDTNSLILGCLTLLIVFFIPKKVNRVFPSQIIALLICTYISIKYSMPVERISQININIPSIIFPNINVEGIIKAIPYAAAIAVICSSESMLTGLVADSLTREKTMPKKLLLSQGIGNVLCSLTGSMPGSAATMRTVAAIRAGATTKLSAVINSVFLVLVITNCTKFVEQVPLCVLAGILIKIGYDIIDIKILKVIKYAPKDDLYVLLLVFFLTVFYNLIFAVGAGITLAALLYAKRVADSTSVGIKTIKDEEIDSYEKQLAEEYKYTIRVFHIDGQFFFGSATQIVSQFDELLGTKYLILNYESNSLLDISAIFALEDIIIRLQSQNIKTLLVIKNENVLKQLNDVKIPSQIGVHNVFFNEYDAVEHAKMRVKRKLLKKICDSNN